MIEPKLYLNAQDGKYHIKLNGNSVIIDGEVTITSGGYDAAGFDSTGFDI